MFLVCYQIHTIRKNIPEKHLICYLSFIYYLIYYLYHAHNPAASAEKKKIYYLIYYLYHAHKHAPSAENPENVHIQTHTSCTQSRGFGWRIHCGVEVTESSTNTQHTLSNLTRLASTHLTEVTNFRNLRLVVTKGNVCECERDFMRNDIP